MRVGPGRRASRQPAPSPVSWTYAAVTSQTNARITLSRACEKSSHVESTPGGTGKTPIAIAVANILRARRLRNDAVSRLWWPPRLADGCRRVRRMDLQMWATKAMLLAAQAARHRCAQPARRGAQMADSFCTDVIVMDGQFTQNFYVKQGSEHPRRRCRNGLWQWPGSAVGPLREARERRACPRRCWLRHRACWRRVACASRLCRSGLPVRA